MRRRRGVLDDSALVVLNSFNELAKQLRTLAHDEEIMCGINFENNEIEQGKENLVRAKTYLDCISRINAVIDEYIDMERGTYYGEEDGDFLN